MTEILNLIIQGILMVCAVLSIFLVIFGNWKKKQQDALDSLRDTQEKEIAEIKAAVAVERADRVEKTSRIHMRIDEMQKELIGDLRGDMSEIKGQLKGVSNIMSQIQGWFIDQAGQGKLKG